MHVAADEYQGELIFLHKVKDGAVDDSYGIQVAKLADLPNEVIERAQVILDQFEQKSTQSSQIRSQDNKDAYIAESQSAYLKDSENQAVKPAYEQTTFSLFDDVTTESEIEAEIRTLNISNMTPLDALIKLNELQKVIK